MTRAKKNLLCRSLMLLALLLVTSGSAGAQVTQFQVRSFTEQCARLLEKGLSAELASLYHYPGQMSTKERDLEQSQIEATLTELGRLFGAFRGVTSPENPQRLHQFEVQSSTASYWSTHSRYFQVVYNTTFEEFGPGALVFRVVVYDQRLQLRSIGYAVAVEQPGAQALKAEVDGHMTRFFLELQGQGKE